MATPAISNISKDVTQKFEKNSKLSLILVLSKRAMIRNSATFPSRESRLKYVVNQLKVAANVSQKPILNYLNDHHIPYHRLFIINAIIVHNISQKQLNELSQFKEIEKIGLNFFAKAGKENFNVLPFPFNMTSEQSNLKSIQVDRVWNELKIRGKGIVIAGQDSGIAWQHPAIVKQYRGTGKLFSPHDYNWHDAIAEKNSDCPGHSSEPCDDNGHGTHTLGTILGDDGGENRIGIAPEAKWIGCRNMNLGVGTIESYLECFQFLIAPYPATGDSFKDGLPEMAPHIINNSWACSEKEGCHGDEFLEVVRTLRAAGIFAIVSAGNEGPECGTVINPPAIYSNEVLSVGAYDNNEKDIAYFSSRGPAKGNRGIGVDIVAPGVNIRSAVPKNGLGDGGLYDYKSGTSMSGPHIAGVVALLWSANPSLIGDIEKTIRLLKETSTPITTRQSCGTFDGSNIPNAVFGHGLVNAYKLVSENMKK